jgi:thymidylate synthase
MRFDLSEGFPLVTTKKLHVRSIFSLNCSGFFAVKHNVASLRDVGVTIWDECGLIAKAILARCTGSNGVKWLAADGLSH